MREICRFSIPTNLPSLNALLRMHWAKRRRIKNEVGALVAFAVPPGCKLSAPVKRSAMIVRHGGKTLDADNLAGGHKPLVDYLVELRLLWDDSPKWAALEYCQIPGGKRSTEIIISEAV